MLALRWFLDATRIAQLTAHNQISSSMAYRDLHEGIDVLAAAAPGLHGALLDDEPADAVPVERSEQVDIAVRGAFRGTLPGRPRHHPGPHRPQQGRRWTCGGRASTTITTGRARS